MHPIAPTPPPDKVILIHHGALGDYLLAWPAALALSLAYPGVMLIFAGSGERLRWLAPLGYRGCPPEFRRSLDGLYGAEELPENLADCLLVWPYVERRPDLPRDPRIWALPAVAGAGEAHARDVLARGLAAHGVDVPGDWLGTFRALFAGERRPGRDVLLFPGAGHPLKQWPLVQFFQLADMLAENGWNPRFVLGPAELERGMDLGGRPCVPAGEVETLAGLERLLLGAAGVVGPDTGPMHLAGMLGVPGVALFGPTRAAQWGPVGLAALESPLDCAPCTRTCADLDCPAARCLAGLDAERVWRLLEGELAKGNRLSSPGILESRSR